MKYEIGPLTLGTALEVRTPSPTSGQRYNMQFTPLQAILEVGQVVFEDGLKPKHYKT